MKFDRFIITHIIYVMVTFKSTTSSLSMAHMAQLVHLDVLNAWIYDGVLFVS